MVVMGLAGVVVVDDGQVGVINTLGHISDTPVPPGIHFFFRLFTTIEKWNVKTQELKETADVPSSEGLVASLDVSLIYSITPDNVPKIRKTIGDNYVETVMEPYMRQAIRTVVSGYPIKALYSQQGRDEIAKKMREMLNAELSARHIVVQDMLLRSVKLPAAFSQSIELKLKTEQEALQKEFELQKAQKDAEIAVAKAEGVAKANKIISESITEPYLRYMWIDGIRSEAHQIIYVPTEAGLPILEAGKRPAPATDPAK